MIRAALVAIIFIATVLALLPFQLVAMMFDLRWRHVFPLWFHRVIGRAIGVRIREIGQRAQGRPLLILANHVSWLDILVIGALGPVVFVAKHEVARWPVFGWLARLQQTIFIERERRHKTGEAARAMAARLLDGDPVVLFAEGTSSDGNHILPFRSALVGAVHHALADSISARVTVQPLSIAYTRLCGLPMGRALRGRVAWYGDVALMPHLLGVLMFGAVDVTVSWGDGVAHDLASDRKAIARENEHAVRRMTARALRD